MRFLSALVVTLALATVAPVAAQEQPQRLYRSINGLQLTVGQPAPDFAGSTNLASFRGKPLLINFYSVYCAPCIREIPKLNALKHLNPELQVLAITPDSPSEAAAYAKQRHLAWPIVTPGQDYLFNTLGIKAFPTFAILDAHGNLVSATYGNQLGGEDGNATLPGIAAWVEASLSIKVR